MTTADNVQEIDRRMNGRLFGLSWSHFLNDGAANYLPGILPAVLISLHEPVKMAGVLMAALMIGQALQPLMGWIADRVGGRSLIIIGLLSSSLGGALLGVAHYAWVFIGLLLLIGVGSSLFHPQALAVVRSMAQTRQGLTTSVFLVGGELGRGIWPTVASFVVVHHGISSLWIFAVPALITIPFLMRFAPKLPAKRTHGNPIHINEHLAPMSLLIGYTGLRALMTFGLVTFVPILWKVYGGTLVGGASIITTMLVIGVIGNLGGGHLADRFGRRPVLVISAFLSAVLIPVLAHVSGAWIWVIAAIVGIFLFLSASTTVLIGQDIFPENRSMGSGIALGFSNGIGAVLVLVIGLWVTDQNVLTVFWILAGAGLISALLGLLIPRSVVGRNA
ncbi:MFS transporter [Alicyclobacillus sp. SO9]|uniref:MFS transporter n=1 Tax=Alicyclobacillus sp. SO9 TaxID=2665646 RepID=UPI0018E6F8E7|nr:MFS transporter [Alicyclobacillus sp. SO9]QQE79880.1 MFS transporter [Alicyclobacillus sp. SO9]